MPDAIFTTLSLDELAQQPASRSKPQSSDRGYLASVGVVAAVITGVFFGISFSLLLAPEQIIGGSGTGNRGTEVETLHSIGLLDSTSDAQAVPADAEQPPSGAVASLLPLALAYRPPMAGEDVPKNATASQSSVSAVSEAVISTAAGAVSSTRASAVGSMANETTLARPATVSPPERFPAATTATPPASPPMAAEIAELLARGDAFVVIGDIASARVFYERAASAGDGRGRRCGWGRLSIRLFSGGLDCPTRSATQLRRALGTAALLTSTTTKLSVGGMLVIRDRHGSHFAGLA